MSIGDHSDYVLAAAMRRVLRSNDPIESIEATEALRQECATALRIDDAALASAAVRLWRTDDPDAQLALEEAVEAEEGRAPHVHPGQMALEA